jgi:positive regulator of sigma E activity
MPSRDVPPAQNPPPVSSTARLRTVGGAGARRVLGAYSGEHGVYGIVLVTAVIAVGWNDETDLDVLVFLLGTVVVFWLAHIYAGVVASRSAEHPEPLTAAIRTAMKHASGMLIAMLIPAALLCTAVLGWVEEYTAYFLALGSGLLMLAIIGYLNAARNRSRWPWRIAGVLSTTLLGALVIGLSILVH